MAIARPFAYNTGPTIPGTEQLGNLSIGDPTTGFTTNPQFWNGPDEELGYVIAIPVSGQTQPTPLTVTWDPNYIGTGNLLSEKNTVVTNNAANSSVLSTRLIVPNEKVMFSVKINQMIYGYIGFGQQDMDINSNLGSNDGKSVALGPDGNYYFSGTVQNSGLPSWGNVNDIIDVALNTNTNSIWFRVNGGNWNGDLNENPELGSTLSVPISNLYGGLTPFPVNIQGKATILGQSIYSIPTGYKFLGETLASVGFYRSSSLTESSFVLLTNRVFFQNFTSGNEAKTWLNDNGYWTSFVPLATPTPTVTNTPTVTPTNTNTPTNTSTSTQTPTPSVTNTQTPTTTTTLTATQTPSATPTSTTTQTPTVTPTNTRTPTQTPTVSPTTTRTPTPTPTTTQTPTNTPNLQGFSYSNFTSTGGTVSVGNVSLSSNILYLTTATGGQVGNVYRTTAIQYNRNFSTTWSTFIGGGTGADGYCVQWTPTNNTNGPTGGGVGLLNSAINAITFLTYTANNYTWYKNGVSQGATSVASGFWRQTLYFWGDYNHSAQTFALYYSTTNIKPGSPNQTFNSFSFDTGSYYMGFGAGTGGSTDNHELRSWSLQFT